MKNQNRREFLKRSIGGAVVIAAASQITKSKQTDAEFMSDIERRARIAREKFRRLTKENQQKALEVIDDFIAPESEVFKREFRNFLLEAAK